MPVQVKLRIGTRGSPLALAQATTVRDRLVEASPGLAAEAFEIVVIRTSGDRIVDRPLADIGGKGLFTKEIEAALLDGGIDLAVHSLKDMPTELPRGLAIGCYLEREDPRDAFISAIAATPAELPAGSVVGTSSLRRRAQILSLRPDLEVVEFRGNVETRLRKLKEGVADATLLAIAGLRRLGMAAVATSILAPEDMLPAVGQGAVAVQMRAGDARAQAFLAPLGHPETGLRVGAERALLAALDGSCRTPIAALAEIESDGGLWLRAAVFTPDGRAGWHCERRGRASDGEAMGRDAGAELKARAGGALAGLTR